MKKKILIVGGVAGGASAASRLRRLDEHAEIILFERDEHISFANCGLPYYIGDIIEDREDLLVQTPATIHARFNIDVRINSEVISVDTNNNKIKVKNKNGEIYEETYDYLILSPGAKAVKPPIEGIDSPRIFKLRNVADTDAIKSFVDKNSTQSAIIIGGGYIGVEMAENLREREIDVKLVDAAPHILAPFDSEMAFLAEQELEYHDISLFLNDGIKSFNGLAEGIEVTLKSGKKLSAHIVILAMGVTPDTDFIKDSGIELGTRGHIKVNDNMMTNYINIFAVGDAIEVTDFINGEKTAIALAGPANKQGRIAADNICGRKSNYKGTQGTSVIKIFSITCAATGNNERTLQRMNLPYKVIYLHPASHASYYPGSSQISLKLIFNESGTILGAQAIGSKGVEKRIDAIAAVIRNNGTIYNLSELELSYAPPYSSAKDPVNMAGFIAENVLEGLVDIILPKDLENYDRNLIQLVDVRTQAEYIRKNISGSINIPVDDLRHRLNELDRSKEIWVYCQVGLRGYVASRLLTQYGFKVKNLSGGYKTYCSFTSACKNQNNNSQTSSINPNTQIVKDTGREIALMK